MSATVSVAVKVPAERGPKVTEMAQFAPAAKDAPQVFVCANSAALVPAGLIPVMVSEDVPVFVRVAVCAALVLPTVPVKLSDAGVSCAVGDVDATPLPVRETVCGELLASSAMLSVAV